MEQLIATIWGFAPDWWSHGDLEVRAIVIFAVFLTIALVAAMGGMVTLGLIAAWSRREREWAQLHPKLPFWELLRRYLRALNR